MKPIAVFRALVILVALAAAAALIVSGPGYRLGIWHFRTGISLVRWATYLSIAGVLLAVMALAIPRLRGGGARRLAAALVVAADPAAGRLEATDTTLWFGFHDDIVVRIAAAGDGSRVDVRSVSRVGRSDIGTNAKRIREFLAKLRA